MGQHRSEIYLTQLERCFDQVFPFDRSFLIGRDRARAHLRRGHQAKRCRLKRD